MSRKDFILELIDQIQDCNETKLKCPHLFEQLVNLINRTICIENVPFTVDGSQIEPATPTIRQQYKMAVAGGLVGGDKELSLDLIKCIATISGHAADAMITEDAEYAKSINK